MLCLGEHLWQFLSVKTRTTLGVSGGPFVFLSAIFAYVADWTSVGVEQPTTRARKFSILDGLVLFVAGIGPLLVGTVFFKFNEEWTWLQALSAGDGGSGKSPRRASNTTDVPPELL